MNSTRLFILVCFASLTLFAACDDEEPTPQSPNNSAACETGMADCPCFPDNSCAGALTCQDGVCGGTPLNNSNNANNVNNGSNNGTNNPNNGSNNNSNNPNNNNNFVGIGLGIEAAGARSCELVVSDPDEVLGSVSFDEGVEGRFIPRGTRTAIAFLRKADSDFEDGQVTLEVRGGAGAAASLGVMVAYCFDADGEEIPGVSIEVLR